MDFSTECWLIMSQPNGLLILGDHLFLILNYNFLLGRGGWLIPRGLLILTWHYSNSLRILRGLPRGLPRCFLDHGFSFCGWLASWQFPWNKVPCPISKVASHRCLKPGVLVESSTSHKPPEALWLSCLGFRFSTPIYSNFNKENDDTPFEG